MNLRGKKVLVIGLGASGIAACRYLVMLGAHVVGNDIRSREALGQTVRELEQLGIEMITETHELSLRAERSNLLKSSVARRSPRPFGARDDISVDFIVVSPGVPLNLPLIQRARERKVPVVSEMELAFLELARLSARPPAAVAVATSSGDSRSGAPSVVAITGTNGKTTTTSLIAHLLKACGQKVCVAGNIGTPLLDLIDEARTSDWIVLEVSSFQLETTPSLHPHVAVWLNATPDHLDWHASFADYVAAKRKIFEQLPKDGFGIYNDRDEVVTEAVAQVGAGLKPAPTFIPFHGDQNKRWDFTKTKLFGVHNEENMMAAVLATQCCLGLFPSFVRRGRGGRSAESTPPDLPLQRGGIREALHHALETFTPLPHRLEFVREVNGVRYYDDSKGTNVGATVKALESFTAPIILIAGGRDKGGSYDPLLPLVKQRVKHLILIGEATTVIQKAFGEVVATTRAPSLEEAVLLAARTATAGDVVLLSPACSSFDMFRDYAHRGDVFQKAVLSLRGAEATKQSPEIKCCQEIATSLRDSR